MPDMEHEDWRRGLLRNDGKQQGLKASATTGSLHMTYVYIWSGSIMDIICVDLARLVRQDQTLFRISWG